MFKCRALGCICLLLLFGGCSLFLLTSPSAEDRESYHQLMVQSDTQQSVQKNVESKTRQQRRNVTKYFYMVKGKDRLQMHLHSATSDLLFEQLGDRVEMTERFEDLQCLLQDALMASGQQKIRQIEAKKGLYYYKSQDLTAEDVKMADYIAPGDILTPFNSTCIPLMKGAAEQVKVSLNDPHRPLKAHGFQATINEL